MAVITGKPIWDTPAGDLGTIQEGKFYQLTLYAHDDITNTSEHLYYIMVAGELPEGIQCRKNGLIEGIPKAVTSLQGVPLEVKENVTSKFTVRVYTEDENEQPLRVADRTFTITVSGADAPTWVTQPSDIKDCYDGDHIEYQFEYTDPDPDETHTFTLLTGELPPGVTLTKDGLLSGVVQPAGDLPNTALQGFDATGSNFDVYPFDHATQSSSKRYNFTVELTDGRLSSIQAFSIYVYSKDNLTADITDITVDNFDVTADLDNRRVPYLTTPAGDLGTYRHDNYFAYQFEGIDVDGDPIEFALTTGDPAAFDATGVGFDATGIGFDRAETRLPPGLKMDIETGFLYGYIPNVGLTDTTYTFGVQVKKKNNPDIASAINFYTMRIIGAIDSDIQWITPTRVATMNNGDISIASVKATASSGAALQYKLKAGSDSSLPQGLELQSSGHITGQTSFQAFMLDGGTTTFDEEITTRLIVDPTVFDRTYYFTVEAFNESARISVFKDFELYIDLKYLEPYETVYISATPELIDRADVLELLDNKDIFIENLLYRSDDPNFGIAKDIKYNHAYGMKSRELSEYIEAMKLNHYRKNLVLGDIKTARALDSDGNVIYEVIYSEVQQKLKNRDESVELRVARTPFFEDFQSESIIDPSKTASSTTVTADQNDVRADVGVNIPRDITADTDEITTDSTFVSVDTGVEGRLVKLTADIETVKADTIHTTADATYYYDYRSFIEDLSDIDYVYPNSLDNMRTRIINRIGQYAEILPEWMKSKQEDGRVLGFTPAWVIAYAKPGKGNQIKYYIENLYEKKLNSVDFEADRYIIDKSNSQNWNTTDRKWNKGRETTFNRYIKSRELTFEGTIDLATELGFSSIHNRTVDYVAALGGIDGKKFANELDDKKIIFVNQENFDDIDEAFTRYNRDAGDTSELIPGVEQARDDSTVDNERIAVYKITVNPITEIITLTLEKQIYSLDYVEVLEGTQYGAAFMYIPRAPYPGYRFVNWQPAVFNTTVDQTLFDGGSLRFISNKDKTIIDDRLDKYVLYPQHTIIGNQDYIKL